MYKERNKDATLILVLLNGHHTEGSKKKECLMKYKGKHWKGIISHKIRMEKTTKVVYLYVVKNII